MNTSYDENLKTDYSKLMEYLSVVDKALNLSEKLPEIKRLVEFNKSMLMPSDRRNLLMYSKLLRPDILEKKCIYCMNLPPKINYKFVEKESIKEEDFKPTPIHICGRSYPVQSVCVYEKSWLDEYYYNSFNTISNSILKEEENIHELNERDGNDRLIHLLEEKEKKNKEIKEMISNEYFNQQENDENENEEGSSNSQVKKDDNKSEISEEQTPKEENHLRIIIDTPTESEKKKSKCCCCCCHCNLL